jgi:hypothetical protein
MDSLEAIRDEVLSPGAEEILPIIYLAANEFEYDGYSGNMQSWNAFGKWLYSLLQTRSTLNPEQIIEIKSISNVHESIPDKVRALYEYMQSKTRYVSIQLGIGGYQPMSAQSVADLGYGDCKALSNYMRVILSAVDIPSNYTVIGAGRSHRSFSFRDFPNTFQANHVILTVPMEEDTLFLECTSQKNPCGYLGSFTGNRPALLVSEDGGRLIKTPSFNLNDYLQQTIGTCQLNSNGTLQGNYCRTYTGLRSEAVAGNDLLSKEDQRAGYLKKINIPSIKLEEIEYDYQKDRHPAMNEKISFNVPGYAQISGTRVFFTPNLFNQWHYQLPANEDRQHPMMIDEAIYDIDTFTIQLPEDYSIEAMPSEVSLETPFGRYHSRVHFENNKLVYFRLLQLSENTYPKEMYADLRSFFKTIQKTDRAQVVLIEKKT